MAISLSAAARTKTPFDNVVFRTRSKERWISLSIDVWYLERWQQVTCIHNGLKLIVRIAVGMISFPVMQD